jgi:hypothetical protein
MIVDRGPRIFSISVACSAPPAMYKSSKRAFAGPQGLGIHISVSNRSTIGEPKLLPDELALRAREGGRNPGSPPSRRSECRSITSRTNAARRRVAVSTAWGPRRLHGTMASPDIWYHRGTRRTAAPKGAARKNRFLLSYRALLVPRGGFEPPTPAFSVQCSTN